MTAVASPLADQPRRGQPSWELALLYPIQGEWTEEEYLELETAHAPRMFELVDGVIEVLPVPGYTHQDLMQFIYDTLGPWVRTRDLGKVYVAPFPVRIREKHFRQPDVVFLRKSRMKDRSKPPEGADLVVEVTSPGNVNRERDLKRKRRDYARAGIPEYWIVDSDEKTVTVLTLGTRRYRTHGVFRQGETATSATLNGFAVDVTALFAAGEGK